MSIDPPVVAIKITYCDDADRSIPLPDYATDGAAGADVRANFADRSSRTLARGERILIPTGLCFEIPHGYEVQVRPRSGLALKHGITLVNAPGTIDYDYRGPVGIILINHGAEDVAIAHGERVAQLVVAPVTLATFDPVDGLSDTSRASGGFGSTGRG